MWTFPDPEMFQMQERKEYMIQLIIFRGFTHMFVSATMLRDNGWFLSWGMRHCGETNRLLYYKHTLASRYNSAR